MNFRYTLSRPVTTINSMPSWDDLGGTHPWTIGVNTSVDLDGSQVSNILADDVVNPYLGTYNFLIDASGSNNGGSGNTAQITFYTLDENEDIISSDGPVTIPNSDLVGYEFAFEATGARPHYIGIKVNNLGGDGNTVTVDITYVPPTSSVVISEPDGWEGAKIKWERDPSFFSLIEYYEGSANGAFIFYGKNEDEGIDGGIEFIRAAESDFGFDANVVFLVEWSDDDINYTTLFSGLLDISEKVEMEDNKMQVPVIRDNLWAKFINRYESPVNVSGTVDLDGNTVDAAEPSTIHLTSQVIRYSGEYEWDESLTYEVDSSDPANEKYYQLDWDKEIIDDLEKRDIPRSTVTFSLADSGRAMAGQFEAPWDGEYTFDIRIVSADLTTGSYNKWTANGSQIEFRIGRAGLPTSNHELFTESTEGPYTFTPPGGFPDDEDTLMIATFQGSFTLRKGDQIVIYAVDSGSSASGFDRTFFGQTRWTYKTDCAVATTANITLSGEQTIDGVLTSASRVLVKDQGDPTENGIYVSAAGAWSRASDADTAAEYNLAAVYVTGGTNNTASAWKQINTVNSLGVDDVEWIFLTASDERLWRYPPAANAVVSYCNVVGDTTFRDTEAEGYLIHDLIHAVLVRMGLGSTPFYSEFLGHSTNTKTRQYDDDGCGWMYFIAKGLQIRGYSLSQKPFFISMKEIWEGINPIFNLGLGYEEIEGSQVIRIEEKGHFLGK